MEYDFIYLRWCEMSDSDIYDILIQHFKNVEEMNDILQKVIKKLKEHEDRINALEIEPKNRIDNEDDWILIQL